MVHPSHSMRMCFNLYMRAHRQFAADISTITIYSTTSKTLVACASIPHVATEHQPFPPILPKQNAGPQHTQQHSRPKHTLQTPRCKGTKHPAAGDAPCKPYASAHRPLDRRGIALVDNTPHHCCSQEPQSLPRLPARPNALPTSLRPPPPATPFLLSYEARQLLMVAAGRPVNPATSKELVHGALWRLWQPLVCGPCHCPPQLH